MHVLGGRESRSFQHHASKSGMQFSSTALIKYLLTRFLFVICWTEFAPLVMLLD